MGTKREKLTPSERDTLEGLLKGIRRELIDGKTKTDMGSLPRDLKELIHRINPTNVLIEELIGDYARMVEEAGRYVDIKNKLSDVERIGKSLGLPYAAFLGEAKHPQAKAFLICGEEIVVASIVLEGYKSRIHELTPGITTVSVRAPEPQYESESIRYEGDVVETLVGMVIKHGENNGIMIFPEMDSPPIDQRIKIAAYAYLSRFSNYQIHDVLGRLRKAT